MAKCKKCTTNIPEGTEYCKDCLDKDSTKNNESYLDSLLNSVINKEPSIENTYKKNKLNTNNNKSTKDIEKIETISKESYELEQDEEEPYLYSIDLNDINDFSQFDMIEDLENDIIIGDEELFGTNLEDIFTEQSPVPENLVKKEEVPLEGPKEQILQQESRKEEPTQVIKATTTIEENNVEPTYSYINSDEITINDEDDRLDSYLNDVLKENDLSITDSDDKANSDSEYFTLHEGLEKVNLDEIDDLVQEESEEDEILQLLNQISADDPVAEDVQAITKLLSKSSSQNEDNKSIPSSVGEVFSDALKVVSSLEDADIDEINLLENISEKNQKKVKKKTKKEKIIKEKKKQNKDKEISEQNTISKKGVLNRLFANVEEEGLKKTKTKKRKPQDSEIVATKETGKKRKKKSDKNKIVAIDNPEDSLGNEMPDRKNKSVATKDKKEEKKEKKKKTKEIMKVMDEIDEDEGRINRVGASIVFLFFGLLVMVLLIGTNIFSYSLSINNATNYFEKQKYNQAYSEVYGIDIKDEDIQVYDKIMTVMFVNKQLNSYNNYYSIGKYPEALDSLLMGLRRYDKYLELATILGIKQDLDYVRDQILAELNNVFHIAEADALQIINSDSQTQYSLQVYDVVLEKMND